MEPLTHLALQNELFLFPFVAILQFDVQQAVAHRAAVAGANGGVGMVNLGRRLDRCQHRLHAVLGLGQRCVRRGFESDLVFTFVLGRHKG